MKKVGIAFTFLCTYLLTIPSLQASSNFLPGYIINLQKDTVDGLIDYQEWPKNPDFVAFKQSKKRPAINYYPTDIVEFGVLGKKYVGAVVQKETSPFLDDELERDPALHFCSDTVFLQTLIGGEKSLYYLKDWDNKEHFYIKEDDSYTLLLHKTYVEYTEKRNRKEYHNMRFIGQLTRYFWEDPSLYEKIAACYYDRTSLESLFHDYLKLPNKSNAYVNTDGKVSTTFGLVAGASYTLLSFETEYFIAGFEPSIDPTGGFWFDMAMNGKFRHWSLYNELLYSSYSTVGYVDFYLPPSGAIFNLKYLKLNSMFRFQPSWFFLNAGFSNGFCIKHYSTEFADIRKYEIGIIFGAGIKYKDFSIELREDVGDGMSPYVGFFTQTNRLQVLLGYRF